MTSGKGIQRDVMRCCKTDTSYSAFIALTATVIRLK